MHALILIPFYFFTATGLFLALLSVSRLLRLRPTLNSLAIGAVGAALLILAVPLSFGCVGTAFFTGLKLLGVAVASALLAAVDVLVGFALPLSLDTDLRALGARHAR